MRTRASRVLALAVVVSVVAGAEASFFGGKKGGRVTPKEHAAPKAAHNAAKKAENKAASGNGQAGPHLGLVQVAGHFLFEYLKDYKFYIKLLTGYKLDESMTVWVLSIMCNSFYCLLVLFGFMYIPRNVMLTIVVLTAAIGPALVLIVIGILAASMLSMALYPMHTVAGMWLYFFLQSQFFQRLGTALNLDVNGDGHIDFWDFFDYMGTTRLGRFLGLDHIHKLFQTLSSRTLLDEIEQKLDTVEERMVRRLEVLIEKQENTQSSRKSSSSGKSSKNSSNLTTVSESKNSSNLTTVSPSSLATPQGKSTPLSSSSSSSSSAAPHKPSSFSPSSSAKKSEKKEKLAVGVDLGGQMLM